VNIEYNGEDDYACPPNSPELGERANFQGCSKPYQKTLYSVQGSLAMRVLNAVEILKMIKPLLV
jgi:hypothetical protein